MTLSPDAQGHAPRDGRYVFSARFAPGQLTVWINGNPEYGAGNSTEFPMDATFEGRMSELDSFQFEAIPGPLLSHDVEFLGP